MKKNKYKSRSVYFNEEKKCSTKNNIIYVKNECELHSALNKISDDTTIKICNGCYEDINLNISSPILCDKLTIVGDTTSVVGVTFMHGGYYNKFIDNKLPHLSPDIGCGDNYQLVFNSIENKVTVLIENSNNLPNFTCVAPCSKVKIIDKNCNLLCYTIRKGCQNELYFNEDINISTLCNESEQNQIEIEAVKGVAFVIVPNVTLKSDIKSNISGVKCLRMVGINFEFDSLIYGEVYSNIENCLFGKNSTIYSNAKTAVNRSPNTILGTFILNPMTNSNFIYNSVWYNGHIIANNAFGLFACSTFSMNKNGCLLIKCNSNINGSKNSYYNSKEYAIYIKEGSKLKSENALICGGTNGIISRSNCVITTGSMPVIFQNIVQPNALDMKIYSFFYNWLGDPNLEIGSTDVTSQYFHTE